MFKIELLMQLNRIFPKYMTWKITGIGRRNIQFPSETRIKELWQKHVSDGSKIEILTLDSDCLIIKSPKGTDPMQRESFRCALEKECNIMNGSHFS